MCKIERVREMRGFASRGQAAGGYTTTERGLDGGRNAGILKRRWRGKKWRKMKTEHLQITYGQLRVLNIFASSCVGVNIKGELNRCEPKQPLSKGKNQRAEAVVWDAVKTGAALMSNLILFSPLTSKLTSFCCISDASSCITFAPH